MPFVFRHFIRVFAELRTKSSAQHTLKGAGLCLENQLVSDRVAEVLIDASHCVVITF